MQYKVQNPSWNNCWPDYLMIIAGTLHSNRELFTLSVLLGPRKGWLSSWHASYVEGQLMVAPILYTASKEKLDLVWQSVSHPVLLFCLQNIAASIRDKHEHKTHSRASSTTSITSLEVAQITGASGDDQPGTPGKDTFTTVPLSGMLQFQHVQLNF